jgi:hypothetical protein
MIISASSLNADFISYSYRIETPRLLLEPLSGYWVDSWSESNVFSEFVRLIDPKGFTRVHQWFLEIIVELLVDWMLRLKGVVNPLRFCAATSAMYVLTAYLRACNTDPALE